MTLGHYHRQLAIASAVLVVGTAIYMLNLDRMARVVGVFLVPYVPFVISWFVILLLVLVSSPRGTNVLAFILRVLIVPAAFAAGISVAGIIIAGSVGPVLYRATR